MHISTTCANGPEVRSKAGRPGPSTIKKYTFAISSPPSTSTNSTATKKAVNKRGGKNWDGNGC